MEDRKFCEPLVDGDTLAKNLGSLFIALYRVTCNANGKIFDLCLNIYELLEKRLTEEGWSIKMNVSISDRPSVIIKPPIKE